MSTVVSVNLADSIPKQEVGAPERIHYINKTSEISKLFKSGQKSLARYLAQQSTNIRKFPQDFVKVIPGGVEGDRHCLPPHFLEQWAIRKTCAQVILLQQEVLNELNEKFSTNDGPGTLGENILTNGIDIDSLPLNTILHIGETAKIQVVDRRSFCFKFIFAFTNPIIKTDETLNLERVGVEGIVIHEGIIRPGDPIRIEFPAIMEPLPHKRTALELDSFRK
jgi:MOSC domain-containing protein YiiM